MVSRDTNVEDECLVLEAVVDRHVKYFKCVFHRNTWYYAHYIICKLTTKYLLYFCFPKRKIFSWLKIFYVCPGELLNYALLIIQFAETDKFLNGKFAWYGYDALDYLSSGKEQQKNMM